MAQGVYSWESVIAISALRPNFRRAPRRLILFGGRTAFKPSMTAGESL
jgi:hypothetical protein